MKKQIANIEKHKSENQAKKKEKMQEAMSRKEQYINEAKQKTYFQCGSRELFICYFEIE